MARRIALSCCGSGMWKPAASEAALRRDVHVEDAGIVLGARARHHRPRMGLVGTLVLGEADVPVEPEDRTLAVGLERNAAFGEGCGQIVEKRHHRLENVALIERPVLLEPFLALMETSAP